MEMNGPISLSGFRLAGNTGLTSFARSVFRHLQTSGLRKTASLIWRNLSALLGHYLNRRFDKRFHVDTSGVVQLAGLTCDSGNKEHGFWYEPTPIRTLKRMFSLLRSDIPGTTFIDFGSGKGRTILFASNYNFRRIIGVEFARELHVTAERNIETYSSRTQKCFAISSVCVDASRFSLPHQESCVLYFFHPFKESVMNGVLDKIEESYRQNPRRLILVYYCRHRCEHAISRGSFLRRREAVTLSAEPSVYRLEIYETKEAAQGFSRIASS